MMYNTKSTSELEELIVINTPPFNSSNNIGLGDSDPTVKYDQEQYKRLVE